MCDVCGNTRKASNDHLVITKPMAPLAAVPFPPMQFPPADIASLKDRPCARCAESMSSPTLSKWLRDQLDTERQAVARQLEEDFGRCVKEHHKLLLAEVDELRRKSPSLAVRQAYPSSSPPPVQETAALVVAPAFSTQAFSWSPEREQPASRERDVLNGANACNPYKQASNRIAEEVEVTDTNGITDGAQEFGEQTNGVVKPKRKSKRPYDNKRIRLMAHEGSHVGPRNFLTNFVYNNRFEAVAMLLIVLNTIQMALEVQYLGKDTGFKLKFDESFHESAADSWPGAQRVFDVMSLVFSGCFILELILRIGAAQWRALLDYWVWLDAILVGLGLLDVLEISIGGVNPSMMRLLRLSRVMRILKVVKNVDRKSVV